MAYQVPKQWNHGDEVCAADLQKYSDAIAYLYSFSSGAGKNYATPFSRMDDTQQFWFVHSQRYLIYVSTGVISDPGGVGEDVTLSSDQSINAYDLDTIPWLNYGNLYKVVGCSVCMEDRNGI